MMPPEPSDDQQQLWRDVLSAARGAEDLHAPAPVPAHPFAPTWAEGKRAVALILKQVDAAVTLIVRMVNADLLPPQHVASLKKALSEQIEREAAIRLFGILYDDGDDDSPSPRG